MDDQDMKNKKDLLDALDDPGSLSQEELDAILDDPKELEDARLARGLQASVYTSSCVLET